MTIFYRPKVYIGKISGVWVGTAPLGWQNLSRQFCAEAEAHAFAVPSHKCSAACACYGLVPSHQCPVLVNFTDSQEDK